MKSRLSILSEDEIDQIHRSSLQVLEKRGALIGSPRALRLLEDAGAEIEHSKKLAKIPSNIVEQCLRKHPRNFTLYGRKSTNDIQIADGHTYAHTVGGCLNVLDQESGTTRSGTGRDVQDLMRLIDASNNIHQAAMLVFACDSPPQVRDIRTVSLMLRNTTKNCSCTPFTLRNMEYILKLAATVSGGVEELRKKPLICCGISPTSPLELSEDAAEQMMKASAYGLPVVILPCPQSGATSPATLAGTLVQTNAEFLISHTIIQLANPGSPEFYAARPVAMDMRTGSAAFGAIEFGMMSAAAVQLARRYNIASDLYGLSTDAKTLDEQAAYEKALIGLLSSLSGADFLSGAGDVESGVTASAEQLIIDNEILALIVRATNGIRVDADTLAAELIQKIGPGGHYLSEPHTRKHYFSEHYAPQLSDRRTRPDWSKAGHKDLVRVAHEKVDAILKQHSVEPLDRDMESQFETILSEADKELLGTT
jgi:trimethylamine--corrinoid protein Co-methyltransferase